MIRVMVTQQLPMPALSNVYFPYNSSLEDELKRLFANSFTLTPSSHPKPNAEDVREEFRRNGRDSEYVEELENGVIPINSTRRKKHRKPLPTECVFCKNNGEDSKFYKQHVLKDINGRIVCPVLREYHCPICDAHGDWAHTVKYCPANKNPDPIPVINTLKVLRNSSGKRRSK